MKIIEGYKLVHRNNYTEYCDNLNVKIIDVQGIKIGSNKPVIIAGPCAVETYEQTIEIAKAVKKCGGHMLRGGAFKPRTSPYEFQGLGREGLEILKQAKNITGLPIVTEVLDPRFVDMIYEYADVFQIGSRNMYNVPLLKEVAKTKKPVILKRAMSAGLQEWLCLAEYIALEGNMNIILCERGIRTFPCKEYSRNTLDLNIIYPLRESTFLPIIVDPSHATGASKMVSSASLAALQYNIDGLLIEVIQEDDSPDKILCDGFQGIRPSVLEQMIKNINKSI